MPGEFAVVKPEKQWTYAGNPYLSGVIETTRLDAKALGLLPLGMEEVGIWSPAISMAHTRSSWICAKRTSVVWMPTHTSALRQEFTFPIAEDGRCDLLQRAREHRGDGKDLQSSSSHDRQ